VCLARPAIVKEEISDTGSRLRLCDVSSAYPRGRSRAESTAFGAKTEPAFSCLVWHRPRRSCANMAMNNSRGVLLRPVRLNY